MTADVDGADLRAPIDVPILRAGMVDGLVRCLKVLRMFGCSKRLEYWKASLEQSGSA